MSNASMLERMSTELREVAARAKRDPNHRFFSLAHFLDVAALQRSFAHIRNDAAAGTDGVTKAEYGQALQANLQGLHGKLKSDQYRHQPIRQVHLPKEDGKTRPIGVSCLEDKVLQGALCEVLTAVYEQDFLPCSFGFRPGRGAHDAIRALSGAASTGALNWVLEADIKSFFNNIDRKMLMEMLQRRVADGSTLRLVGKCLHVGVLDGAEYSEPDIGTTQGSSLSPLLGNVYLHYVLDSWFEHEVRPRLRGRAVLVRYADDFVIGFECQDDAERAMLALPKRMERYGLTLHPDKTRLLPFGRPPRVQQCGKGPSTFDFLGFTIYWRRTRRGFWGMWFRTRSARLRRTIQAISDWCRANRHQPVAKQHAALARRLNGHINYFGVNGNWERLATLIYWVKRAWFKWLNRRSERASLTWKRFGDLLKDYPLPAPRIPVQIWAR